MSTRDKAFKSKLGHMVRFMRDPALSTKKHMLSALMLDLHDNYPNATTLMESHIDGCDLIVKLKVRQAFSSAESSLFATADIVTEFEEDLLYTCVTHYLAKGSDTCNLILRYGSIVTDILCSLAFSDAITPEIVSLCRDGLTATLYNQPLPQEWLEKVSSTGMSEGSRNQDRFNHYIKTLALTKVNVLMDEILVVKHPSISEFSIAVKNSQHLVPARHYPRTLIQRIYEVAMLIKADPIRAAVETVGVRESLRELTASHHPKYKGLKHA